MISSRLLIKEVIKKLIKINIIAFDLETSPVAMSLFFVLSTRISNFLSLKSFHIQPIARIPQEPKKKAMQR